jgi:hypothetical protein
MTIDTAELSKTRRTCYLIALKNNMDFLLKPENFKTAVRAD